MSGMKFRKLEKVLKITFKKLLQLRIWKHKLTLSYLIWDIITFMNTSPYNISDVKSL